MSGLPSGAVLALIPLYACADRLWGAAKPAFKGKKAVIALGVLGVGFLLAGWPYAALGAVWLVYRSLPFKDGAAAPTTSAERVKALIRHVMILPVPVFIAVGSGGNPLLMAVAMTAFVACAVVLAIWYGEVLLAARERGLPIGSENTFVELARGAAFGLALATYQYLAH